MKRACFVLLALLFLHSLFSCTENGDVSADGYFVYTESAAQKPALVVKKNESTTAAVPDTREPDVGAEGTVAAVEQSETFSKGTLEQTKAPVFVSPGSAAPEVVRGVEAHSETSDVVYVTPTGKKYHLSASCAGKNAMERTRAEAAAGGYTPCKKCASP